MTADPRVTSQDNTPARNGVTLDGQCRDCGMHLRDAGEYHPYAFCVLKRAGLDPWATVRVIAGELSLGDPGETPPLMTETHFPAGAVPRDC